MKECEVTLEICDCLREVSSKTNTGKELHFSNSGNVSW